MLRIISANLNGIRSASTKGYFDWLARQGPDIVCMQEIKAQNCDLTESMRAPHVDRHVEHAALRHAHELALRMRRQLVVEPAQHAARRA